MAFKRDGAQGDRSPAFKDNVGDLAARKSNLEVNYLDFEGFQAAIVRLTIIAGDMLGGQKEEQL